MLLEVGGLDHQRLAFPVADRVTVQERLRRRRMLAIVQIHSPLGVHPVGPDDDFVLRHLDVVRHRVDHHDGSPIGMQSACDDTFGLAALRGRLARSVFGARPHRAHHASEAPHRRKPGPFDRSWRWRSSWLRRCSSIRCRAAGRRRRPSCKDPCPACGRRDSGAPGCR